MKKYTKTNGIYSPRYSWLQRPYNHKREYQTIVVGLWVIVMFIALWGAVHYKVPGIN